MRVNPNRCPQNHPCPAVRICPVSAIEQKGYGSPKINSNCIQCGKCIKFCPTGAIQQ